jgi:hypothetical protein
MQAAKAKTAYFAEITEKLRIENEVVYLEVMGGLPEVHCSSELKICERKRGEETGKGARRSEFIRHLLWQ